MQQSGENQQDAFVRFIDQEFEVWEGMHRVALSAAGGGLAISFLVFQIDGAAQLDVWFLGIWGTLLLALVFGFASYGLRAMVARQVRRNVGAQNSETRMMWAGDPSSLIHTPLSACGFTI